jgi:hypothetical protein
MGVVWFCGWAVMFGIAMFTVTVKLQLAMSPTASVAVQLTVVAPLEKVEPEAGVHRVVTPGQLSVAVGVYETTAVQLPGELVTMFAGHVMLGGCASLIVTVNVQLVLLADVSVAVQVTVVVPLAKVEPEAGVQLTVTPGQLSLAVAA